jgi:tetratricopeptide (TPR) repeat protein
MFFVLVAFLLGGAARTDAPWYELYGRAVELVQQGDGAAAAPLLEKALAARPDEGIHVPAEGGHYVDYLPHVYLAIAFHLQGRAPAARAELASAEQSGVASRSDVGRPLLEAYKILLEATPTEAAAPARYKVYPRKAPVLSEADYRRVQTEVLSRCRLKPDAEPPSAPWYFHYELGLELARRGDSQRALDAFVEAANRRPEPQHTARLYGMWFTDYLPYFHIARAHSALGNWECAADALQVSEKMKEISPKDPEFQELRELAREVKQRAQP